MWPFGLSSAVLALCVAAAVDTAEGAKNVTFSGTAEVLVQNYLRAAPRHFLALRLDNGTRLDVDFGRQRSAIRGIISGQRLTVTGRLRGEHDLVAAAAGIVAAPRPEVVPIVRKRVGAAATVVLAGGVRASSGGLPLTSNPLRASAMRVLIIPIMATDGAGNACPGTSLPTYTPEQLWKIAVNGAKTVSSQMTGCSGGKTVLSQVGYSDWARIGCSGNNGGKRWSVASCDEADIWGLATAADAAIPRYSDIDTYQYRIYVTPVFRYECFVGMGTVGCTGGGCRTWINGNYYDRQDVYIHELGHNLGLMHAGMIDSTSKFSEYADGSCTMGGATGNMHCYNAPHQWALGWQALQQADGSVLQPGATIVAKLPPQHASPAAGMRIVPDWAPGARPLYLSYRLSAAQDADLPWSYSEKVSIYQLDSAFQSGWMATVAVGGVWAPDGSVDLRGPWAAEAEPWTDKLYSSLVVRVLSGGGSGGVTVSVCRRAGAETAASCAAGRDNDCNGMAGAGDAGCRPFIKAKPPPPIRRPPPVRKFKTCASVDSYCSACDQAFTRCLTCKPSYVIGSNGKCRKKICSDVDANCSSCNKLTSCRVCNIGYKVKSGKCIRKTCADVDFNCASCDPNFSDCVNCKPGFVKDSRNVCVKSTSLYGFVAEGYGFRCAGLTRGRGAFEVQCDMGPSHQHEWETLYPATEVPALNSGESWQYLRVGDLHACGIASGRLFCWGSNSDGQTSVPELYYTDDYWTLVSVGWYHTCGLTRSQRLACWGRNTAVPWRRDVTDFASDEYWGQADVPDLGEGTYWKQVSAGASHTCGITGEEGGSWTEGGDMNCWGTDADGEARPPELDWGVRWVVVSAGLSFTCGGTSQNTILCFGSDYFGQLKMPSFRMAAGEAWWSISAGGWHWCGLYGKTDGKGLKLFCNGRGMVPKLPSGVSWRQVSASQYGTCAVATSGVLYCFSDGGVEVLTAPALYSSEQS